MIRTSIAVALAIGSVAEPAFADVPGRNWVDAAKVKAMFAKRGYRVTKIEADDGHWEGEAVRRDVVYEFHVDPHSGRITRMERDRHR